MTQTSLKSLVPKQELDPSFSGRHLFWWPAATDTQRCDCRCLGAFGALPAGTDPRAAARQSAQGVGVDWAKRWQRQRQGRRDETPGKLRLNLGLEEVWRSWRSGFWCCFKSDDCSCVLSLKKTITLLHDASCSVGSDFQMIFGWEVAEGPNFVVDTAWPCFAAESTIWNTTWKLGKVDSEEAWWYYYFNIIR